jgi:hypothetical protein
MLFDEYGIYFTSEIGFLIFSQVRSEYYIYIKNPVSRVKEIPYSSTKN